MGKKLVEKLPHSCGTNRGLQVFLEDDGRYTGFCFKCQTYVKNPYADHGESYTPPAPSVESQEDVQKKLKGISGFPQEKMKEERIDKEIVQYFGVRLGFDQETASVVKTHYYPYEKDGTLKSYQVKILDGKKFFTIGDFTNIEPFGWRQALKAGGRTLFITEGQKDAMALTQVVKKFSTTGKMPAVISLPNGVKSVDKMQQYIKHFDRWAEVVLCFDMDDAGREAVKNFLLIYPEAKVAKYPLKDAHDMLMANREEELFQAVFFNAKTQLPDKLKRSSDVWDLASKRPEQGMSWPWPSLTSLTRGIRRGEGYYIGGGVKMGLQ